jgi:hypothetical protein
MSRGDNFRRMWQEDPDRMRFFARKGLKRYYEIGIERAKTFRRRLKSSQAASLKRRDAPVSVAPIGRKEQP